MILVKTPSEIKALAESNRIVAKVLKEIKNRTKVGTTTKFLNNLAEHIARSESATPGFKGYEGFPYSICASVNDEIVHGFPNDTPLKHGDIISVDFGIIKNGYYGDAAITIPIGRPTPEADRLIQTTYDALMAGIEAAQPGNKIGHISKAIQNLVEKAGFNVVRNFTGHGIGKDLHEDPPIENYLDKEQGYGYTIKPGMTLSIEPMVVQGGYENKTLENNWTVVTADGGLAAHFEHTIVIKSDGPSILSI